MSSKVVNAWRSLSFVFTRRMIILKRSNMKKVVAILMHILARRESLWRGISAFVDAIEGWTSDWFSSSASIPTSRSSSCASLPLSTSRITTIDTASLPACWNRYCRRRCGTRERWMREYSEAAYGRHRGSLRASVRHSIGFGSSRNRTRDYLTGICNSFSPLAIAL